MSPAHGGLDILLVDDSEDDILMAREVFSRLSFPHKLSTVTSATEALDYLRGSGKYDGRRGRLPNLILLDINMPGMDGFELLKIMKADPALKKIPVIMVTSSSAQEDIRRSYDCGAVSFIAKPDNMENFRETMSRFGRYWLSVSTLPQ